MPTAQSFEAFAGSFKLSIETLRRSRLVDLYGWNHFPFFSFHSVELPWIPSRRVPLKEPTMFVRYWKTLANLLGVLWKRKTCRWFLGQTTGFLYKPFPYLPYQHLSTLFFGMGYSNRKHWFGNNIVGFFFSINLAKAGERELWLEYLCPSLFMWLG